MKLLLSETSGEKTTTWRCTGILSCWSCWSLLMHVNWTHRQLLCQQLVSITLDIFKPLSFPVLSTSRQIFSKASYTPGAIHPGLYTRGYTPGAIHPGLYMLQNIWLWASICFHPSTTLWGVLYQVSQSPRCRKNPMPIQIGPGTGTCNTR